MIERGIRSALLAACLLCFWQASAIAQPSGKALEPIQKNPQETQQLYSTSTRAVSESSFESAHEALLDAERMQFERPTETIEPPRPSKPSPFLRMLGDFLSALGPVFQAIFYLGMAAIAASILYFILRHLPNLRLKALRRKDKSDDTPDHIISTVRPDEKKARAWLEEADALAKEGRFSEAVHLLLFRSIEDIQTKRKAPIPSALTAREIEHLDGLPTGPRNALRPIIAMVERSFFGGQPVNAENWTSARKAYEAFAFGEAWT